MRVNYSGLGDQANEPFWRFISCCLSSSPEILSSDPDLSDLHISFELNGLNVDLLGAWQLYTNFRPPETTVTQSADTTESTDRDAPRNIDMNFVGEILSSLTSFRSEVESSMQSMENTFDSARDYASSAAADVAADYARDRVHEELSENGPDFDDYRSDLVGTVENIIERLEEIQQNN